MKNMKVTLNHQVKKKNMKRQNQLESLQSLEKNLQEIWLKDTKKLYRSHLPMELYP